MEHSHGAAPIPDLWLVFKYILKHILSPVHPDSVLPYCQYTPSLVSWRPQVPRLFLPLVYQIPSFLMSFPIQTGFQEAPHLYYFIILNSSLKPLTVPQDQSNHSLSALQHGERESMLGKNDPIIIRASTTCNLRSVRLHGTSFPRP